MTFKKNPLAALALLPFISPLSSAVTKSVPTTAVRIVEPARMGPVAAAPLARPAALPVPLAVSDTSLRAAAGQTLRSAFDAERPHDESPAPPPSGLGRRIISDSYHFDGNKKIKVAFFDADSTLRVSLSGSVSANGPKDVMILPWIERKMAQLVKDGYLIVIVSNQAGIPEHISLENADKALNYTVELIRRGDGDVHYYDFAENDDSDRKPGIGMATRLEKNLQAAFGPGVSIDKENSLMVGDSAYKKARNGAPGDTRPDGKPGTHFSNSDRLFAENYGIAFFEPTDFFGWRKFGVDVFETRRQVEDFLSAHPQP